MKRTLFLIRHAHTPPGSPDEHRQLSNKGEQQARAMGERLALIAQPPVVVICSPASRTATTAALMRQSAASPESVYLLDRRLYESSLEDYLDVLHESLDEQTTIWLVGHNWAISALARELTGETTLEMAPCTVVKADFESPSWRQANRGSLTDFDVLVPED
ncbi:MAG: SixA phosphatase family protein [Bacteroidota bacterium]